MRLPLSIRVVVPVGLIFFTLILAWWSFEINSQTVMERIEQRAHGNLGRDMTRLQATIEHGLRVSDIAWVQEEIAELGANPDIMEAVLLDQNDMVIASAYRANIGKPLQRVWKDANPQSVAIRNQLMANSRERFLGEVLITPDNNCMIGVYPVRLATPNEGLRSRNVGLLCVHQKLTALKKDGLASVWRQTLDFVLGLGAFALILGVFFHLRVTRRIETLVDASRRMAEGDLETPIQVNGRDELANLSLEFNKMMFQTRDARNDLKQSRQRFRTLIESSPIAIYETDAHGNCLYVNLKWQEMAGLSLDEAFGDGWKKSIFEIDQDRVFKMWSKHVQNREPWDMEYRFQTPDGQVSWVIARSTALCDANGLVTGYLGANIDITERKQAEENLRERKRELRVSNRALTVLGQCNKALVHATTESSLLHDICQLLIEEGSYRLAWVGFAENDQDKTVRPVAQMGYDDEYLNSLKLTWDDIPRGQGPTGQAIRTGQPVAARYILTDPTLAPWREDAIERGYASSIAIPLTVGQQAFGAINIYSTEPDAFNEHESDLLVQLADDLSYGIMALRARVESERLEQERKDLEDQLRQAQKMEAIGQLAGGVAHDFNNLLTAIMGNSEAILSEIDQESPTPSHDLMKLRLEQIQSAGIQASTLTKQLLSFSRRETIRPVMLDPNQILGDMEGLLGRLIGEHIKLDFKLNARTSRIYADPGQIEQVIMNFVVNAADAMPTGGRVEVRIDETELDESYLSNHPEAHCGKHIILSVIDTGTGMSTDTMGRMFEPFFTTKPVGKGTGLGLAAIYGIAQQLNGHITVDSKLGMGTTFSVYIPAIEETNTVVDSQARPTVTHSGGTILVCEDQSIVRDIMCVTLRQAGYKVLEAENGKHAMEVSADHTGPIDMLISDVIMPEMSGKELADKLGPLHPDMSVLFVSGYAADHLDAHGKWGGDAAFLQKPFGPSALLKQVSESLDSEFRQRSYQELVDINSHPNVSSAKDS